MPYIDDIFYRLYNGNPTGYSCPIILLHGSGGSHLSWPGEMRRLDHKCVIALDLPGHGNTASSVCHSIQTLVFYLRRFYQGMGISRAVLVGHSLGALLALHYAAAYPGSVLGMLLLACGTSFSIPTSIFNQLRSPQRMERIVESFGRIAFDEHSSQAIRREVLAPMHTLRKSTLLADLAICANFSNSANYGRISCPTKIIVGENDLITLPASACQLAFSLPDADYSILPNCGHLLLYEELDSVVKLMSGFLRNFAE